MKEKLMLEKPAVDEVTLWLRREGGVPRNRMVKVHKGLQPQRLRAYFGWDALRRLPDVLPMSCRKSRQPPRPVREVVQPIIPIYVQNLTGPYRLECRCWEVVEYARKVIFVGAFIFVVPGTLTQAAFGVMTTTLFFILCAQP